MLLIFRKTFISNTTASLIFVIFSILVSSCSFNGKLSYILYDKNTILDGDLIYQNRTSSKYNRFDLNNNKTTTLNIPVDDIGINHYSFFINNLGVKHLFELEKETDTNVILYECDFHTGKKIRKIYEIKKKGNDYIAGDMSINELCYYSLFAFDKAYIVNLETKDLFEINENKQPFMFYNKKYIIVNQGSIILSDLKDMSKNTLLFKGNNPLFCQTLNSIMYTSIEEDKNTIKIYKLIDNTIIDTGLCPISGDRFDKDRFKYYFLNEPYIIYGIKDKNLINNFKASFLNIITGGMITDRPCKYIIFNYKTHKDVGYIKNASVLDIKEYF